MEKRKKNRKRIQALVDFVSPGWSYLRTIGNISTDGMFIRTRDIIPPGDELTMRFGLEGQHIKIRGKVEWAKHDGIGISFLPGTEKERLKPLVDLIS